MSVTELEIRLSRRPVYRELLFGHMQSSGPIHVHLSALSQLSLSFSVSIVLRL